MARVHLVLVGALLALAFAQRPPVGPLFGPVPVVQVIDGDTLVVASNVGPRTVRLIGVDAPEMWHPTRGREPFGPEAAAFVRSWLPAGTPVWLELDLGVEDDFGRLLAYVYVEDPDGDWSLDGLSATQVNLALAASGFGSVMTIAPNLTYADLYEDAVAAARADGRGVRAAPAEASRESGLPPGPIVIACALYDPEAPNDTDGEWVSLLVREPIDTRGYYLRDEGSGATFRLPAGVQEPGEITVHNPGQGVWNNGGDTIFLELGGALVDTWDYGDQLAQEGVVVCRDDP